MREKKLTLLDELVNEAKREADQFLASESGNIKNTKFIKLMHALKKNPPYNTTDLWDIIIISDHLMNVAEEDEEMQTHLAPFRKLHDKVVEFLASGDTAIMSLIKPVIVPGREALTISKSTYFIMYLNAIQASNYHLVCYFLYNEEKPLDGYFDDDKEFEISRFLGEQPLHKISPLILASENILKENGVEIFNKIENHILSVDNQFDEYFIAFFVLLHKNRLTEAKLIFDKLNELFERNLNLKKEFIESLSENDGELLFDIAETGDVFLFGALYNICKYFPKGYDVDLGSFKKENKTLLQVFAKAAGFQNLQLGKLVITKYLDAGTSSYVFKGRLNNCKVAIKCLHTYSPKETLANEIRVFAKIKSISSPYIAKFFGHVETQTTFALILGYSSCGNLRRIIHYNVLTDDNNLNIAIQLFSGLSVLHKNLIVYGDCKLDNILLAEDGDIKLTDFGLSVLYQDKKARLKLRGGSKDYMAPERFQNSHFLFNEAARTDIYSAALIIWELYAREDAYAEITEPSDLHGKVISGHRPDLVRLKNVSIPILSLIARCWDGNSQKRPNADEAHQKLTNFFKP